MGEQREKDPKTIGITRKKTGNDSFRHGKIVKLQKIRCVPSLLFA